MTATQTTVLRCDGGDGRCREMVLGRPRETEYELHIRAMREQGWRYSAQGGPPRDLCRWHA